MPFSTEELAKKFGESAEDVKKNLEGMLGAAGDVDKVFEKMTERQEAAAQIQDKFAKALASSSKSLTGIGHSGISAARGIKTIDSVSRSAASSLGSLGIGAVSAVAGFKALSSGASSFSSDIENTEKSIAGLVKGIGGLEAKLGGLKAASVSVDVVIGSLSALDDFEKRIKALPTDISVNISTAGEATTATKTPPITSSVSSAAATSGPRGTRTVAARLGKLGGKVFSENYASQVAKDMRIKSRKMSEDLKALEPETRDSGKREQFIKLSFKIAKDDAVAKVLEDMDEKASKVFKKDVKKLGMESAIESLISKNEELQRSISEVTKEAVEAAEALTSPYGRLKDEIDKASNSVKGFFKKGIAGEAASELESFADGAGKSATGMLAAGLAGAYLSKKLGDVAADYAAAAIGLAKYRTETKAMEETIIGLGKGALEQMRKQLDLTREDAAAFFEQVRRGVNDLGLSQGKIMEVSNALSATFGGTQTARLKEYIDLLEIIPTLDTDLKITASMDDQAAAIFALAEAGKMEVVMDLQGAGLLGGKQEKKPGADMANTAAKTAAIVEGIHDTLLGFFPEAGIKLSAIVEQTSKFATGIVATIAAYTAFATLTRAAMISNLTSREQATAAIVSAIAISKGQPPPIPGGGSGAGGWISRMLGPMKAPLLKLTKGLSLIAIATLAAEYGFGKLEDHLLKTGNAFGAAQASVGKSAATIAGLAAAGATLGSVFPVVGTAAGAVAGALVGLYLEFDNLSESIPKLAKGWFGKRDPIVSAGTMESSEIQSRMQMKLVKSGLELQRTLKKIDQVGNTAKNKIYEMQKGLAGLKIESLQEIGGTAEGFNSAIQGMRDSTSKQYKMQRDDFKKMRGEILSNSRLNSDDRRAALQDLNKKELVATQNFVDGVNKVVAALFNTPQIIQAGLKAEISGVMLDFADMGGMGGKEIGGFQDEQEKALIEKRDMEIDASKKAAEETASAIQDLSKKRKEREEDFSALVDQLANKRDKHQRDELEFEARKALVEAKVRKSRIQNPESSATGELQTAVAGAVGTAIGGTSGKIVFEEADRRRQAGDKREAIAQAEAEEAAAQADINTAHERHLAEVQMGVRLARAIVTEEKKSENGEVTKVSKVDTVKAGDILKEVVGDLQKNSKEIEKAQNALIDNMGVSTAVMAKDISGKISEAKTRAGKADTSLKKANTSGEGVSEAKKEKEEADTSLEEIQSQMDDLRKKMSEKLKKLDPSLDPADLESVLNKMTDSSVGLGDMEVELKKHTTLWTEYDKGIKANIEAMGNLSALKSQRGILDQEEQELKSVLESENGITLAYSKNLDSVKKVRDASKTVNEGLRAKLILIDEETRLKQQESDKAGRIAEAESSVGDGIKAQGKYSEAQLALVNEQVQHYRDLAKSMLEGNKVLEDKIRDAQKEREKLEKEYAQSPEGTEKVGVKVKLDTSKAAEDALKSERTTRTQTASDAANKAHEAAASLGKAGEGITDALDAVGKSLSGVRLKNLEDYADVLASSAEYYGSVSDAARDSFEIAKDIANQRYNLDKEALEDGLKNDKARNESRLKTYMESEAVVKVVDPAEKQALMERKKAELLATTESKYRVKNAQIELNKKKDVVEAAERSKTLKMSEVGIQEGLIDDAMSFASEFGGSFASINALQNLSVGVARQQLDIAKEFRDNVQQTFDAAAGDAAKQAEVGMALMKAQADVATKTLGLRRKELGVQKNMMEQMLGGVFGEMRSNFGARRQMGSDVSMMGINATRMKSASGMYVNTPGGKPGTIEERRQKRMLGGAGGAGPLDELAKMGGPMAEVAKAMNKSPSREQQAKLLEEANATSKNTKDVANSTSRGDQPGSFYTHDTTAEGLLGGILGVLRELTVGMLDSASTSKSKDAGVVGKRLDDVIAGAAKTAASVKATTTQKEDTTAGVETIKNNSERVAGLEDAIRIRENENPIATGVEDHNRIMAGRPMTADGANKAYMEAYQKFGEGSKEVEAARKDYEIASSNSVEANKASVGENRASPVSAAKKARNMSKMVGIGGRSSLMGTMLGGMRTGIKEMGGLGNTKEMSGLGSMKEMRGLKPLGGVTKQGGNTSGGVKTVGGATATGLGMTKAGYAANTAGGDTMASRAAGTEVAPPSVGMTAARAPGGSTGGGGIEAGSSITVKGEMMVKFDNKMFQQQMTEVVLRIMNTGQAQKQIQNTVLKKS